VLANPPAFAKGAAIGVSSIGHSGLSLMGMAIWAVTAPPEDSMAGARLDDDVSKVSILLVVPLLL